MVLSQQYGKDTVIFATRDDHKAPSSIVLPEPEIPPGIILPNGEINWLCPCVRDIIVSPCGYEFREAFGCSYYSVAEPKGSDCVKLFSAFELCMAEFPELYKRFEEQAEKELGDIRPVDMTKPLEKKEITTKGNIGVNELPNNNQLPQKTEDNTKAEAKLVELQKDDQSQQKEEVVVK